MGVCTRAVMADAYAKAWHMWVFAWNPPHTRRDAIRPSREYTLARSSTPSARIAPSTVLKVSVRLPVSCRRSTSMDRPHSLAT